MASKDMTAAAEAPFKFTRSERYRTICRTLPYVYGQAVRKSFRSPSPAKVSTAEVTHPEFHRVVHDVYCAMFLRGYRQVTHYPVDPSTGLALVLFTVFIYAFDDEFEKRSIDDADTAAESIVKAQEVSEVWAAMGAYLAATGRSDEIRHYIMTGLFGAGFDDYRRTVPGVRKSGDFAATRWLVEYDSGVALGTVYQIIRLFNRHSFHQACETEFHNLGVAGKFLDDMSDYTDDVQSGSPNLLDALAREVPAEFAAARSALAGGEPVTMHWWRERCPVTFGRYLDLTRSYYDRVHAPALRLPLDVFLMLLGTQKFWAISTVRASRRMS